MRSSATLRDIPSPYRGLRPFTEADAPYFFGRQAEQEIITANLLASRLTLLYGQSGVGKTSVLRAGVVHQSRLLAAQDLAEARPPEQIAVYFNAWRDDPIGALYDCIGEAVGEVLGPLHPPRPRDDQPVIQGVRTWTSLFQGELLIILDQFEEYFLYHPWEDGDGTFAVEFPRAVTCPDLRVGFLVSIREDALPKLDRFKGRIPYLFDNRLSLEHLGLAGARAAIEGPVAEYNRRGGLGAPVQVEPALVDALLEQVRAGAVRTGSGGLGVAPDGNRSTGEHKQAGVADRVSGNGDQASRTVNPEAPEQGAAPPPGKERIETAYLQVVLSRLWKEDMQQEPHVMRVATLERLGGAEKIIRTDLDEKMSALSGAERVHAAAMLRHLVTPSGSKIALTATDLAYFARAGEREIEPALQRLCKVEILRRVPSPRQVITSSYEIGHDVLGHAILDWQRRYVQAQKDSRARGRLIAVGLAALILAALALFVLNLRQQAQGLAHEVSATADVTAALNSLTDDPERSLLLAMQAAWETFHRDKPVGPEAQDALHRALHVSRLERTMAGHRAGLNAVAFAPNGSRLATAGRDSTVRLWDAFSGKELRTLRGHTGSVTAVAFSPDGRRLITASRDSTARIWNAETGALLATLRGHRDVVYRAVFVPDESRVVTVGRDGVLLVWSAATGERLRTVIAHGAPIHGLAIDRSGALAATGSEDHTAAVWALETGRLVRRFVGHGDQVNAVAFSPDGGRLATGSYDETAAVWDVATGERLLTLTGHRSTVSAVAFSPDGATIATGSWDHAVKLWDAATGRERFGLVGHKSTVHGIAFSHDGSRLATASGDGTAKVWNVSTSPAEVISLPGERGFTSVAYSPDSLLATGSGNFLILWNARFRRSWTSPSYRGPVERVAFSRDGSRMAAAGTQVMVWDLANGGRPLELSNRSGPVKGVAFNDDGSRVATAGVDAVVRVWSGTSGDSLFAHTTTGPLYGVALSPDGHRVAAAGEDGAAMIWDIASGSVVTLRGHTNRVRDIAFRPDGRWVVTGSDDQTARIWDASSGKQLYALENHKSAVMSVAFDLAGNRVATGSRDGTVKVWDARMGTELLTLPGPEQAAVRSVAFSPSGNQLAAVGDDSTLRVYAIDARELLALARRRVTRALTERECHQFLRLSTCPAAARAVEQIVKANLEAMAGNVRTAAREYAEANRQWPDLAIDPEREASGLGVETLVAEAKALLAVHNVHDAMAALRRARVLDASAAADEVPGLMAHAAGLAQEGSIPDALAIYRAAGDLDTNAQVTAEEWNNLCWYGAIWSLADSVLPTACERAVSLDNTHSGEIRDSRGLARAVTGDFAGAIEDFTAFVNSTSDRRLKEERQSWIDSLRAGSSPFSKERLLELLDE